MDQYTQKQYTDLTEEGKSVTHLDLCGTRSNAVCTCAHTREPRQRERERARGELRMEKMTSINRSRLP